jgi:hypothetical protein
MDMAVHQCGHQRTISKIKIAGSGRPGRCTVVAERVDGAKAILENLQPHVAPGRLSAAVDQPSSYHLARGAGPVFFIV